MSIVMRDVYATHRAGTPLAVPALFGVTLEIETGSFTAVIGRTGSGKSTFAQLLAGLMRPVSGTVAIDGVSVGTGRASGARIGQTVGMAFQYPEDQLFGATVWEDVSFGPRQAALPAEEVGRRVAEALGRVGLPADGWARRSPFELSGGQRRRVALAGVLAMRPSVLVLDEPTAGLDGPSRRELMRLVSDLHRDGRVTVVWVTHSMEEAVLLADDVAVLADGRLAMHGGPEIVFEKDDELRGLGLALPDQVRLMRRLRDEGLNVPPLVRSAEEAARAIAAAWEAGR